MPEIDAEFASTSPAYFLSLAVKNFRCFKDEVNLDLSDGSNMPSMWNVILGENGVGKTSILQLLSATRYDPTEFDDFSKRPLMFHFLYQYHSKTLVNNRTDISVSFNDNLASEPISAQFTYSKDVEDRSYSVHGSTHDFWCIAYDATRRVSSRTLAETLRLDSCASFLDNTSGLINAEEWLLQADYAQKTATGKAKRVAEQRLSQVIGLICNILPSGGVTDIRFGLNEDTAVMTPRVEAKTPYGWVRLRDLSLGYQAALSWMVDLAARMVEKYPNSDNPMGEPAVVLVDEIDLHLHPKWQRELIRQLMVVFPRTQFIVTAHSPLIVQAAPDANIALLKRVGDHVEIQNEVDKVRDWRVDQILTSDVFGLDSTYPEHIQEKLDERSKIATKSRLSAADKKRLQELDSEIDSMPLGENVKVDARIDDILQRAANMVEANQKSLK